MGLLWLFVAMACSKLEQLPLHVGTDCTGLGSIFLALKSLGVHARHRFSSESDAHARRQANSIAPADILDHDIRLKDMRSLPKVDIYIAGFPCQPFSSAGLREGFDAKDSNGVLFFMCLRYIRAKQPTVFILENVQGLESSNGGECFDEVLRALWSLTDYNIYFELLNTKYHGIPQNRARYYFIGILRGVDRGTFCFPAPVPMPALELFSDSRQGRPSWADLPPLCSKVARQNVLTLLQAAQDVDSDPFSEPWCIDCDSSSGRGTAMLNCSPCITRNRAAGHWISNRGRRLSLQEMMRLQGVDEYLRVVVTEIQFRRLLGNSMSINVLERILCSLLPASGLWPRDALIDRYAASAQPSAKRHRRGE